MLRHKPADWIETGVSSANAAQTVTKAAADGANRHFVTHLSVTFGAAAETATGVLVQLKINNAVVMSWYVTVQMFIDFSAPIECSAGDTVAVTVAAGGTSVLSAVNMAGYTL